MVIPSVRQQLYSSAWSGPSRLPTCISSHRPMHHQCCSTQVTLDTRAPDNKPAPINFRPKSCDQGLRITNVPRANISFKKTFRIREFSSRGAAIGDNITRDQDVLISFDSHLSFSTTYAHVVRPHHLEARMNPSNSHDATDQAPPDQKARPHHFEA